MICTGTPNRCQCHGHCPMEAAVARGDQFIPLNKAARDADAKRRAAGDPTVGPAPDPNVQAHLTRLFGLDD